MLRELLVLETAGKIAFCYSMIYIKCIDYAFGMQYCYPHSKFKEHETLCSISRYILALLSSFGSGGSGLFRSGDDNFDIFHVREH